MIVNDQTRVVIWQPFKNYSSSINSFFTSCDHKERFYFVKSRQCTHNVDEFRDGGHGHMLPEKYSSYKRYLPIRNPYDRTISQWKYYVKNDGKLNFDEWLKHAASQPIMYPVTRIYAYDYLIVVESIHEDLSRYGQDIGITRPLCDFPHMNRSVSENPILTQSQKDFIYYFHYLDFLAGSYNR